MVYRVQLRYFTDTGKMKLQSCHLETDMKKLFESKKKVTAIGAPLDSNLKQWYRKKIYVFLCKKNTSMKTYEMSVGSDSINVEFFWANRQSDRLEISLVYNKSNKHTMIYES